MTAKFSRIVLITFFFQYRYFSESMFNKIETLILSNICSLVHIKLTQQAEAVLVAWNNFAHE